MLFVPVREQAIVLGNAKIGITCRDHQVLDIILTPTNIPAKASRLWCKQSEKNTKSSNISAMQALVSDS